MVLVDHFLIINGTAGKWTKLTDIFIANETGLSVKYSGKATAHGQGIIRNFKHICRNRMNKNVLDMFEISKKLLFKIVLGKLKTHRMMWNQWLFNSFKKAGFRKTIEETSNVFQEHMAETSQNMKHNWSSIQKVLHF